MLSARAYSASTSVIDSLSRVGSEEWNRLAGDDPFLRHEFLAALEESGCVGGRSGWEPQFIVVHDGNSLAAAMPLYRKTNSYGEYVFDWAWADAYRRHGLRYYPKLVCAVPFTPATGRRLIAASRLDRQRLLRAALGLAAAEKSSSLHVLFPDSNEASELEEQGLMLREGVQFHWRNEAFESFDDFLSTLRHDKRKKIKQERQRVRGSGIVFRRLRGDEASLTEWRFFAQCYERTYYSHGAMPYLNLEFFRRIGAAMPENVLLIVAEKDGQRIAASLAVHNQRTLYGRYWGALRYFPALHFETCYYQAIEFCIERKIPVFEGGAQGEHKLARGFSPVKTYSAHWLAHPRFARAVEDYLREESASVARYIDELDAHAPFRRQEPQ
jgi:predicted N-acyltransferase